MTLAGLSSQPLHIAITIPPKLNFVMRNKILIIVIFLSAGCGRTTDQNISPKDIGLSSGTLDSLDIVLDGYVNDGSIAGGVALIARQGKIGYLNSFGYADIETNTAMQKDHIFRIASMTKAIVVTGVLMLYEEGHFKLDDPIFNFIPDFEQMEVLTDDSLNNSYQLQPAIRPITIRDLLNHTSGLTMALFQQPHIADIYRQNNIYNALGETEGTVGDMVIRLANVPLAYQPGETWQYGANMDVLGYLIELISGQTLDKFLTDRIFTPLGMKDTYYYLPEQKTARLASLYGLDSLGRLKKLIGTDPSGLFTDYTTHAKNKHYFGGGAGLQSTAEDYYKFLQMLLNYGQFEKSQLLERETVELMTSNQLGDKFNFLFWSNHGFGFGFAIAKPPKSKNDIESAGTYSWAGFFSTYFWVDPKKDLIGILLTQQNPKSNDIEISFKELMYKSVVN